MPDLPIWAVLLIGGAFAVWITRLALRMVNRWRLVLVAAVLLVALLESGGATNLLT